jgi:hypothetical protein
MLLLRDIVGYIIKLKIIMYSDEILYSNLKVILQDPRIRFGIFYFENMRPSGKANHSLL